MYDLLCAILVLTQNAPNHVRRVAAPTWRLFLQLLEDAGPPWLVAALHGSSVANVITKTEMKALLTNSDPGGAISSGDLLALHKQEFTCWKCGLAGHLARNCPASQALGPAADQSGPAAINALAQEDALVSLFQRQARMQDKLEEAGAARCPCGSGGHAGRGGFFGHIRVAPTLSPRAPLLIGGAQSEGYHYVGLHGGLSVWGHSDIIAASVLEPTSDVAQPAKHI